MVKCQFVKIGDTALHTMVRQDRLDCALALITHGAEIDAKDNEVRLIFDDILLIFITKPSKLVVFQKINLWFLGKYSLTHRRVQCKSDSCSDVTGI